MKIVTVFPRSACGRPINPNALYTDKRGLTGSEAAWIETGRVLGEHGCEVTFYGNFSEPNERYRSDEDPSLPIDCAEADAILSWVRPEPLKYGGPKTLRVYAQQCNDFAACEEGWEQYVDFLLAPSCSSAENLAPQTSLPREKFRVFHNGVRLQDFPLDKTIGSEYRSFPKVPGRLLWASSHDRGLHWALQSYQQVRKPMIDRRFRDAYPPLELSLHVAYNRLGMEAMAGIPENALPMHVAELGRRSRYCLQHLPQLESAGVKTLGSMSRQDMVREMQEAQILMYPCDPVNWTEGFSSSVLESMAAGALPVLCFSDAFPELWEGACPGMYPVDTYTSDGSRDPMRFSYREHIYTGIVRALLTGLTVEGKTLDDWRALARARAEVFDWDNLVPALGAFLEGQQDALNSPTWGNPKGMYPWHA